MLFRLFLYLTFLFSFNVYAREILPIPSPDVHKSFLMAPWKPSASSVTVFTDPFCPYCIKAFGRIDELKAFNVFIFWYPIFGKRSEDRIAGFFQCDAPANNLVIKSVVSRSNPGCSNPLNTTWQNLNREMYEAYAPSGVPAYYVSGVKTTVAELRSMRPAIHINASVVLDWSRYTANGLKLSTSAIDKLGVYLPSDISPVKAKKIIDLLVQDNTYDWYLFSPSYIPEMSVLCPSPSSGCNSDMQSILISNSAELSLLFGLGAQNGLAIILNGKLLSPEEVDTHVKFLTPYL